MDIDAKSRKSTMADGVRLRFALAISILPVSCVLVFMFLSDIEPSRFPSAEVIGKCVIFVLSLHLSFVGRLYSERLRLLRHGAIWRLLGRCPDPKNAPVVKNDRRKNAIIMWCSLPMLLLETVLFWEATASLLGVVLGINLALWAEICQEIWGLDVPFEGPKAVPVARQN